MNRLLRWAALPVTDRRWAAPLSALALGFGLFVGVAIGPGAAGTFATGAAQIIEIPNFTGGADTDDEEEEGSSSISSTGGGGGALPETESASLPLAPIVPSEEGESPEATPPPTEGKAPPKEESESEKTTLTGVVLHVNPAAGSYTLVEPGGTLDVIHAGKPPQPGTKVSVPTRLLANGTFAEAGTRVKEGTRMRATFSGIVTYIDPTPTAPAYTVSKRGVSVLVHVHPDPTGAAPALPVLGAFSKVAVDIEKLQPPPAAPQDETTIPSEPSPPSTPPLPAPAVEPAPTPAPAPSPPPCAADPSLPPLPAIQPSAILWQRQVSTQGAPFTYGDFAGIVEAICPDTSTLLISADDIDESQHDLLFTVPATIDPTKFEVGQSILATADIGADGALSLTGLASDERLKGAEDLKAAQGDLVPSKPK